MKMIVIKNNKFNNYKRYIVGALTSKPYAFMSRSWELKVYESIDIFDSFGSNIRMDIRNFEILRVLPKINSLLNEDWISDKVRFCYDGLRNQRLTLPLYKKEGVFCNISWLESFKLINKYSNFGKLLPLNKNKKQELVEAFCGDFIDLETMFIFNNFLVKSGFSSFQSKFQTNFFSINLRNAYQSTFLNEKILLIDRLFLLGFNPRLESPILNLKIRKQVLLNKLKIFNYSFLYNLTYFVKNIGNTMFSFMQFFEGKSFLCFLLLTGKFSYALLGTSFLQRKDYYFFYNTLSLCKNFFTIFEFSCLHFGANIFSGFELGTVNPILSQLKKKKKKLLYLLDMDDLCFNFEFYSRIIYQGHHGGLNAYNANFIFPGVTPYEKTSSFLNCYGILQKTTAILQPYKQVRNDWKIIQALGQYIGVPIYFNTFKKITEGINMIVPKIIKRDILSNRNSLVYSYIGFNTPLLNFMGNYYFLDSICRSSLVMALCASRFSIKNFY